jgi:polyisoprenoid-binding protein YceI
MTQPNGAGQLGPDDGRLLLKTSRTGLGRKVGHDLTIEVSQWAADVVVEPGDPARSGVTVRIDVGSLRVLDGAGGLKPLNSADRADIEKTIREKILRPADHPVITFSSQQVTGTPAAFGITGELSIMGRTQPVQVEAAVAGGRIQGNATITQSAFGIKPYSAFAGALRLADDIRVEFDLAAPAGL